MRAIKVSERAYQILRYMGDVYGETIAQSLDNLIDVFESKYSVSFAKIVESNQLNSKQSQSNQFLEEGLKLLKDVDSGKAQDLENKLKEIRDKAEDGEDGKVTNENEKETC